MNSATRQKKLERVRKVQKIIEEKIGKAEAQYDEISGIHERKREEIQLMIQSGKTKEQIKQHLVTLVILEKSMDRIIKILGVLSDQSSKLIEKEHKLDLESYRESYPEIYNNLVRKGQSQDPNVRRSGIVVPNVNVYNDRIENYYNKPRTTPAAAMNKVETLEKKPLEVVLSAKNLPGDT